MKRSISIRRPWESKHQHKSSVSSASASTRSKKSMSRLGSEDVAHFFRHSKTILGSGTYGEARLIENNGTKYVAKKFKGDDAQDEKEREENTHIGAWKRMSKGCKQYMCRPIRSPHPSISLQLAASQTLPVSTYIEFMARQHKLGLSPALRQVYDDIREVLATQFAEALRCLHMRGVIHGNVKLDNALVVVKSQNDVVSDIKVKLIDFGGGMLAAHKPLVRTLDTGSIDAFKLRNAVRNAWGNTSASPISKGLFSNAIYAKQLPLATGNIRGKYIRNRVLPAIHKNFHALYKEGVKRDESFARRQLQTAILEHSRRPIFGDLSPLLSLY